VSSNVGRPRKKDASRRPTSGMEWGFLFPGYLGRRKAADPVPTSTLYSLEVVRKISASSPLRGHMASSADALAPHFARLETRWNHALSKRRRSLDRPCQSKRLVPSARRLSQKPMAMAGLISFFW